MNTTRAIFTLMLFLLLGTLLPAEASAFKELTDREMNAVTAGSVDPAYESEEALKRIPFHFTSAKGKVDGEVFVLPFPLSMTSYSSQGTLQLTDNAQSNLRSFINVNAVNSPVQILLNLNININSTIGNMKQLNNLLSGQRALP